ncbi:hypothetical protein [Mesorhizobium sp. M00.F.Ca.ET.216.01.1.1]|nr:hypothetical protein [Mesorhizobium sp. M00.F.Ca.ET.216.01.1.1]TGQ45915.1 hypothetical protein EN859_006130 [Mesorhizobium sp. M00.F.Ca.ET.216.01.1.1]TJW07482.1 MAG: hypothetical protein E5W82_23760 [Mesorhizobium sp.]TJW43628.1 MAG: hypothetical protein E5W83_16895 [Mesorhizobium sp.]
MERFFEWAWLKASDSLVVDRLLIAGDQQEIDRVVEALSLIRQYDPIRYRRLVRDLRRIWVWAIPYRGQFKKSTWTCELDQRFVLDEKTSSELIASVIVHEATHARLARVGIEYREELRQRIEQVCIRRQLASIKGLPKATEAFDEAERMLDALPDMGDIAMAERAFAGELEAARYLGVPDWLLQKIVIIRERRSRRSAAKLR